MTYVAVAALIAFLAGSVPFGLLIAGAVKGTDLRQVGSGNIGATNAARALGTKWGLVVLVLDALKAGLPVWLLPLWLGSQAGPYAGLLPYAAGLFAVVGHMFPPWLAFRGGKGVAAALGAGLVLSLPAAGAAVATFVVVFLATRYVSLCSMAGVAAYGGWGLVEAAGEDQQSQRLGLAGFCVATAILIFARHHANIARLLRGSEPRFGQRASPPTDPPLSGGH